MNYDGSIRIDSRIDGKGFNAGINAMLGKLKVLAVAIAAAFSVRAIANFGKSAIDEASKMASAFIGLQSIVEGTGNSFDVAQDFIEKFTADGLVPATNAITAYKNLLLRGYDTSQIEKVLTALKDSAAFGRSAHLTLGEAVQTATEGLKNENSVLVDNAGVTKNVSVLWKEYAESIGTTVDALTKEQKIQAEVNGILNETRFQTGDAAKAAGTYAGQVSALGVSFLNLKVAIGNVLIPIIQQILPIVRQAIDALTVYFNRLATIVSIFFGVDLKQAASDTAGLAGATDQAVESQEDLASAVDDTKKAARGALAAFDELNVLRPDAPDEAGALEIAEPELPALDTSATDASLDALAERVRAFKEKLLEFLQPALDAWDRFREKIQPLAETIIRGLGWAWENILVPFGQWAVQSFLPKFFDLMAAGARLLNAALVVLTPVFKFLWDNILKPLAVGIGQIILDSIEGWTKAFNALAGFLEAHPDLFSAVVEASQLAWDGIRELILSTFAFMLDTWKTAAQWFVSNVFQPLILLFADAWNNAMGFARNAYNSILAIWRSLAAWFASNVFAPLRTGFITALGAIATMFMGVFNGVKELARITINTVIDLINGMLRAIANSINAVISMLNSIQVAIPDWVPVFGGNTWSVNIPSVGAPQIPRLATGAVIPPNSEFLAVLGDQRSGTNIEAPEALLRQLIREEIGNIQANIAIDFQGSLGALVRELKPHIAREDVRLGRSVIQSAVRGAG